MIQVKKHLELLGLQVEDRVTKFKGICCSVSFSLFGYIQGCIDAGLDAAGKPLDMYWYDVPRFGILNAEPVIERPKFDLEPVFKFLGHRVIDEVTSYKGVVVSVSFDLYGCAHGHVTAKATNDKIEGPYGIHISRLRITSTEPVLKIPDYNLGKIAQGLNGPANTPRLSKG